MSHENTNDGYKLTSPREGNDEGMQDGARETPDGTTFSEGATDCDGIADSDGDRD